MSKYKFYDPESQKTFESENLPNENNEIGGPYFRIPTAPTGEYSKPPNNIPMTIMRNMLVKGNQQGELLLCKVAAESCLWDNSDQNSNQWPTCKIIIDRKVGNKIIEYLQYDLKRIMINSWNFNWSKKESTKFQELISLTTYNLDATTLSDNMTRKLSID